MSKPDVAVPGTGPGIHLSARVGASGSLDSGDKRRNDRDGACRTGSTPTGTTPRSSRDRRTCVTDTCRTRAGQAGAVRMTADTAGSYSAFVHGGVCSSLPSGRSASRDTPQTLVIRSSRTRLACRIGLADGITRQTRSAGFVPLGVLARIRRLLQVHQQPPALSGAVAAVPQRLHPQQTALTHTRALRPIARRTS
jgi:hypothetical protein